MSGKQINAGVLRDALKKYGKVEICEEVDNTFHVKITSGFDINARNTFKCMGKILEHVGDKYPHVKKNVSDTDLYEIILKP